MATSSIKIIKVGPRHTRIVSRIIEKSWLWHYRTFIPLRAMLPFAGKKHFLATREMILSPRALTFLALEGNNPVAVMVMIRRPWGIEVEELFILPGYTGKGIGTALFHIARSYTVENNFRLRIGAMTGNKRARRFYEQHGRRLLKRYRYGWGVRTFPSVLYEWPRS